MTGACFQTVFDHLADLLPEAWKEVIFYAEYTAGSCSMKFYVDAGEGTYLDCFHLPGTDRKQVTSAFVRINRILLQERSRRPLANRWNVLTMRVDAQGELQADLDDISPEENRIDYERRWRQKYLQHGG